MDKPLNDRVVFRYSVGDICLFRLGFRASHDNRPFDPHAAPVSIPLEPREIPKGSAVLLCSGRIISHRLWPIQATRSALCYVRNQVRNHYIDLSQGFEKYEQGFSGKTKSTLRRKVRKIMDFAEGTFECRAYRDIESVEGFHRLARRVAAQTYQEKLFGGAIPAASGFVEEMRHLASEDRFRGFLLLIKDTPIAYLYVPVSEDRLIYGYLGHDPEYAIWSPGTVLLYLALERLFAERKLRYFDFTQGEGQTKELFGRANFLRADIYYFRWTARNVLAVCAHAAMDGASSAIGAMLEGVGLRSRIRRLLRRF